MRLILACALALAGTSVAALEVDESEFVFVSDLAARGFDPFATSAVGNASFGMTDGSDLYMCFLADSSELQAKRQAVLLAELRGTNQDRTVPNIPIVCILTQ